MIQLIIIYIAVGLVFYGMGRYMLSANGEQTITGVDYDQYKNFGLPVLSIFWPITLVWSIYIIVTEY